MDTLHSGVSSKALLAFSHPLSLYQKFLWLARLDSDNLQLQLKENMARLDSNILQLSFCSFGCGFQI